MLFRSLSLVKFGGIFVIDVPVTIKGTKRKETKQSSTNELASHACFGGNKRNKKKINQTIIY